MNLRLLGAPTLKDVVPAMVDTSSLKSHIVAVPQDSLYYSNCKWEYLVCWAGTNNENASQMKLCLARA